VLHTGWRWMFLVGLLCGCMACSAAFDPDIRSQVDPTLSYSALAASPASYVGHVVLLGGTIVEATNLATLTRVILLQYPVGRGDRPRTDQPSGGRFLLRVPGYLETAVYRPGRAISVIGEVVGQADLPLGETTYAYPVLVPKALHLWPEGDTGPRVYFGFGMGFSKGW
jgi:outer membrane lipoprotein